MILIGHTTKYTETASSTAHCIDTHSSVNANPNLSKNYLI